MHVRYGFYNHAPGEVSLSISKEHKRTNAGTIIARTIRWEMNGLLLNPSGDPAQMSARILALQAAYATDAKDLKLIMPDGSTDSQHVLLQSDVIGDVRVVHPPSFPSNEGAAYITAMPYRIVVEGDIPIGNPITPLTAFTETVSFSGGGPRTGHLEPLVGRPIRQLLRQYTSFKAKQSGNAVGYRSYPDIPPPIWPTELVCWPEFTYETPKRTGFEYLEYSVSWSYEFASKFPLEGYPHVWS